MEHLAYKSGDIAGILNARLVVNQNADVVVKDILIDSRRLISAENCLFFALETKQNDGHKYISYLYKKGVRAFAVLENKVDFDKYPDATFFVVENTLEALQKLAAHHRSRFDIPVVGITGSNGKTIVKEWLYQLISPDKRVIRSPKSYNSQIGVPLSVWQMNDEHELAIFECGISEPNEMERLQKIVKPTIGIFTNIGEAHSENFISNIQKTGEKLKLFTKVDTLIYNTDQKDIQEVVIRSGVLQNIKTFTWGSGEDCNLKIKTVLQEEEHTLITAEYENNEISITIPYIDKGSVENAIHCWAYMLFTGYNNEIIAKRMLNLSPIAMRLEQKAGINNCTIINDSYNSDFNSLSIALDFLKQQNQHKQKTVILSDILQSGRNEVDLYTDVANLLKKNGIDKFIGIGHTISKHADKFDLDKTFFEDTNAFLKNFPLASLQNHAVLLKGARVFEFERISRYMQQKVHETVLEINLTALVSNFKYFRSKIKKETKIMAMVKAFSYGSGSFEIANVLQYHQVDYLAVAYADEGVELRKAGITLPVMVMNPEEFAFDLMIKHQLEPEIFSFRTLKMLEKSIKRNALPENKPVKVHIKLETGMNRLGFTEEELEPLIERLYKNKYIYVQSVFSHLAGSDKPHLDDFTRGQIERFESMAQRIADAADHPVLRHILNSAGIVRFPEAEFDMVRLGIGLYGIGGGAGKKLRHVTALKSEITQIKYVKKGESVGYNRSFVAPKDMKIGVVSVGYADGLMRNLGNGKFNLYVNNQAVPIVGDVCMDMCMVDLTGVQAKEGATVVVFDEKHPVEEMAKAADTIPYEILSRISRRVKRVYYHE
jgi:alanine racemase